MTVYTGSTPNGPIVIVTRQVSYEDLGSLVTTWRAKCTYLGRQYDVGGESEDQAYQNLIKMLAE